MRDRRSQQQQQGAEWKKRHLHFGAMTDGETVCNDTGTGTEVGGGFFGYV
tara:strand:- start:837 stop:986 length:150 start_codon:yes stop_codon:yes gene_type:complete